MPDAPEILSIRNTANVSIIYNTEKDRFIHLDSALASFTGLTDAHDLEALLNMVAEPDRQRLKENLARLLKMEHVGVQQVRLITPAGERSFLLNAILADKLLLWTLTDLTEEIENLDTIRKYANKKNSILNMLSHDLRGPLHLASQLAAELEPGTKTKNPDEISRIVAAITGTINHALNLVVDLTQRELLETMETVLVLKTVDIARRLEEYMEECRKNTANAGKTFVFGCARPNIYMELDEAKFMQIMNNLVSNALKFTKPGGRITLHVMQEEKTVLFTFSDSGIGIPEHHIPTLFEKFSPAGRTGLNGEPSLGLGLFLVKTIIEWHRGDIWVKSKEGTGTTFYIRLPINPNNSEEKKST